MNAAPVNAHVGSKRIGRPPIGAMPKTHEDHKARMREYAQQQRDDAISYRRLMEVLPEGLTVDQLLAQLSRMNIEAPSNAAP